MAQSSSSSSSPQHHAVVVDTATATTVVTTTAHTRNEIDTTDCISPALARKLIQLRYPNQKISNGACIAISELIRLFIIEARHRATIEAECEEEGGDATMTHDNRDKDDSRTHRIFIRPDHIAKIVAELLMDFS